MFGLFGMFGPGWGTGRAKVTGTWRTGQSHDRPKRVDVMPKQSRKPQRAQYDHRPKWLGWYIIAAALCGITALLSLCLGWIGVPLSILFGLGVVANIANYKKFSKKSE